MRPNKNVSYDAVLRRISAVRHPSRTLEDGFKRMKYPRLTIKASNDKTIDLHSV